MRIDDEECEVRCRECQSYLYSVAIHDTPSGRADTVLIGCPYARECKGKEREQERC